jgi:hypothetical protein
MAPYPENITPESLLSLRFPLKLLKTKTELRWNDADLLNNCISKLCRRCAQIYVIVMNANKRWNEYGKTFEKSTHLHACELLLDEA